MNPDIQKLHPYPFQKLAELLNSTTPAADYSPIRLSIGEPQHVPPYFALTSMAESLEGYAKYPKTQGQDDLREAISQWLCQRFSLKHVSIEQIIPVSGTREALFAFAQAVIDRTQKHPLTIMPNPFYQIYEGAAILAGSDVLYLDTEESNGFLPDIESVSAEQWQHCQLVYLCTPGNPSGRVVDVQTIQRLIELADEHDFIIASDECYSEIYFDENSPPIGLLEACAMMGRDDYARCVVFHSLSKRSNVPGLRSGFVAGDASIIRSFLQYRTYHGCALPLPTQQASIALWQDEEHVIDNRALYREKFIDFENILGDSWSLTIPDGGFYFWAKTPIEDLAFTRTLYEEAHITVLPGQFLARDNRGKNPGKGYVRMALVASTEHCREAARRIKHVVDQL